jgi:hypothetical protein
VVLRGAGGDAERANGSDSRDMASPICFTGHSGILATPYLPARIRVIFCSICTASAGLSAPSSKSDCRTLVAEMVIVEIKAADEILTIHQAQLLTYMKLGG